MEILESLYLSMELDHSGLNEEQKEDRIIQFVDFLRFKECAQLPVKMIDCISYDICVVEINGTLKGFAFFDKKRIGATLKGSPTKLVEKLITFKNATGIEYLWCIFVQELQHDLLTAVDLLLAETNLRAISEKVLLLDFFGLSVREL